MKRIMLAAALCAAILAGCASQMKHFLDEQYELAQSAIDQRQWERAYRLLEGSLDWSSPTDGRQARGRSLLLSRPEILAAAPATFARESLAETLRAHGARNAAAIERRRLDLYRRVANPGAFEQARRQVEAFAAPLDAEWEREAEAQRRLASAEEARKAEEARMAAEQEAQRRAALDRQRAQTAADLARARQNNQVTCRGAAECDRMFALGQAYVIEHSDMKIQVATNTLIETHNATSNGQVSARLIRVPGTGDAWSVVLTANCRGFESDSAAAQHLCALKLLRIYEGFQQYVSRR
jgi:hypothetical protein